MNTDALLEAYKAAVRQWMQAPTEEKLRIVRIKYDAYIKARLAA